MQIRQRIFKCMIDNSFQFPLSFFTFSSFSSSSFSACPYLLHCCQLNLLCCLKFLTLTRMSSNLTMIRPTTNLLHLYHSYHHLHHHHHHLMLTTTNFQNCKNTTTKHKKCKLTPRPYITNKLNISTLNILAVSS